MGFITAGSEELVKDMWLIYGDNGTGKSYLMGSVLEDPRFHPYVVVNGDVSKKTFDAHYPGMNLWEFPEGKPITDQTLKMLVDVRRGSFKTVLFDNISMYMNNYILDICEGKQARIQDWQVLFNRTQAMVRDLKKSCDILIVTALPHNVLDGEGNIINIVPYLNGKHFPQLFNSYFDTIMIMKHTFKRTKNGMEEERYLTGKKEGLEMARDRNGKVGRIDNPTLSKIYDTIKGVK